MQCRRCGFENMPGVTICMRCNATLVAIEPVNVHPPRAGWTRVFRPLAYSFNLLRDQVPGDAGLRLDAWLEELLGGNQRLLWGALSIAPGLGHLLSGRFLKSLPLWLAWLVLLANGLLFQSIYWGSIAFGLAIAMHSWIVIDAAEIRGLFGTVWGRLAIAMVLWFMFSWVIYGGVQRNLVAGAIPQAEIATHGVRPSDFLVFWRPGEWRRGDLVLYKTQSTGPVMPGERMQIRGGSVVGQLLAFPGERVMVGHGVLTVHGAGGSGETYSYPPLAKLFGSGESNSPDVELTVPAGHYLCFPVAMNLRNTVFGPLVVLQNVGLPERHDVWGRGVMIYNTFFHRRPLPRRPLARVGDAEPGAAPIALLVPGNSSSAGHSPGLPPAGGR